MPPHEDIVAGVREWLEYSSVDLDAAEHLLTSGEIMSWIVAYHAQQSAEKALKGFLSLHRIAFPFTHSIAALREMSLPHGEWVKQIAEADRLTEFATTARYPGVGRVVSLADAQAAVEIAKRVLTLVCSALASEGITIEPANP